MHKEIAFEFYKTFVTYAFRFSFLSLDPLRFPSFAGNLLRGAIGSELLKIDPQEHYFRPQAPSGPSGFRSPPRPFALRAHPLNRHQLAAGELFTFDIHFFGNAKAVPSFMAALASWQETGIGPRRSRVQLQSVQLLNDESDPSTTVWRENQWITEEFTPVSIQLPASPHDIAVTKVVVHFLTPTELKEDGALMRCPEFVVLFNRLQERIQALSFFYSGGADGSPPTALINTAQSIRIRETSLHWQTGERRSSRTQQRHPLGGFVGTVVYQGPLAPFFPWLRAAYWTGIGRQTVWGKGVVAFAEQNPY
jgi:hypothetical protein